MSLVLVVVGLLLGAVSVGKDLQRNAEQQRIYAKFAQPWAVAYNEYFARTGVVVGDDPTMPTLKVNGLNNGVGGPPTVLCDDIANSQAAPADRTLYALMDGVGIEMPLGRAEGREARYVYLDSNGNPQEMQVCFQNVAWPDSNDASLNNKNAMVLYGLTPDLARHLDSFIDGKPDARFGLFRQTVGTMMSPCMGCGAGTMRMEWSPDNTVGFGGLTAPPGEWQDEWQVEVVTAYYRMNQ